MRKLSFIVLGLLIVSIFLVAPPASAAPCATIDISAENVSSTSFDLDPARSINITITIRNQMSNPAIFTVRALNNISNGPRKAVLTPDIEATPYETELLSPVITPGFDESFDLKIDIPRGMPATTFDPYDLTLTVTTTSPQYDNATEKIYINVSSTTNIGVLSVDPPRAYVDPGQPATMAVTLRNYGNEELAGGVGITFGSQSAGWTPEFPDTRLVEILPGSTSAKLNVTLTAANTSSAGDVVLNIYPIDQNNNIILDADPFEYTVTVNPVPFLAVTSIEYSTIDDARIMAGMDVTITATVENPSGIDAVDVPMIIYDDIGGDRIELESRIISVSANTNITEDFVISLSKSGVHTIVASVSPNSTGAALQDFSAGVSLDVAISPLIFILIGFIGLAIGMSILVLMIVYDRIRFPTELSLSSLKSEIATSEAGPAVGDISDLDISSVEPEPMFPKADEPPKSREEKKTLKAPPREGRKKERQKLKPKEPAFEEPPEPAPMKKPKAEKPPKPAVPKPAPKPAPIPTPVPAPEKQEKAEELDDDEYLRDDMKDADRSIQEAKLKEIDVTSLERMMKEAKNAYASREFSKARSFTDNISRRIKELLARREEARREIRDAQALIFSLKYTDMDLSQAKSFLTKAETAYKNGDFKESITNASKSKERAGEMEKISENGGPSSDDAFSDSGFDDEVRL